MSAQRHADECRRLESAGNGAPREERQIVEAVRQATSRSGEILCARIAGRARPRHQVAATPVFGGAEEHRRAAR